MIVDEPLLDDRRSRPRSPEDSDTPCLPESDRANRKTARAGWSRVHAHGKDTVNGIRDFSGMRNYLTAFRLSNHPRQTALLDMDILPTTNLIGGLIKS